jgi:adenosylcobinamide amidohydrolase
VGDNRGVHWEVLRSSPSFLIRRAGRFLVVDLRVPHRALCTSGRNGGQTEHLRYLVNHQSCEGAGHHERAHLVVTRGLEGYHDDVCAEIDIPPSDAAVMGTAANMNYAAVVTERDGDVEVTAIVTAGVQSNAVCAGDPATWRETREGMTKVPAVAGTINTILIASAPVTASVLARMAVTMTEGKSAALQDLAVPSCYSPDLATGTGTDQFCVAAPLEGERPLTSGSPHVKFGEIVGHAVRTATLEALRWQNGLEPSLTRGLFHALGRYGVKEPTIFEDLEGLLEAGDLELLRRNRMAAFHEPLVGAAAHALAAVLDRARHQTLPASVLPEAVVQQAAMLAANLAAAPHRWPAFHERLRHAGASEPKALVLTAIALGWREKWRSN